MSNTALDQINTQGASSLMGAFQPSDPYSSLYATPEQDAATSSYFDAMNQGLDAEKVQSRAALQHEVEWALGGLMGDNQAMLRSGALFINPATGLVEVDEAKARASGSDPAKALERAKQHRDHTNKSLQGNENWNRLRAHDAGIAQREAASKGERARMLSADQGFRKEMGRMDQERAGYEGRKATNLIGSYMSPALANAGNAAMAGANSTAGGSLGQAAARRAAMTGFGQQAAIAVPTAVAKQGDMDMQQMMANDEMARQYQQARQQAIQNQFQNNMAQSNQNFGQQMTSLAFQKGTAKDVSDQQRQMYTDAMDVGGRFVQAAGGAASGMTGMMGGGGGGK